jgi:hypothetical protein
MYGVEVAMTTRPQSRSGLPLWWICVEESSYLKNYEVPIYVVESFNYWWPLASYKNYCCEKSTIYIFVQYISTVYH